MCLRWTPEPAFDVNTGQCELATGTVSFRCTRHTRIGHCFKVMSSVVSVAPKCMHHVLHGHALVYQNICIEFYSLKMC
jgi:hypothetical protein